MQHTITNYVDMIDGDYRAAGQLVPLKTGTAVFVSLRGVALTPSDLNPGAMLRLSLLSVADGSAWRSADDRDRLATLAQASGYQVSLY